ncbi:MAG: pteridine-dependent deoxygenase [Gammaproteobacteria bacterium]|nr:MAG: pteridine-dependent deoxygenase [Gammaproteobacteria bacterium]
MIVYAGDCTGSGGLGIGHVLIPWQPGECAIGADSMLGIMRYGVPLPEVPAVDCPVASVSMPILSAEQRVEVWHSSAPVTVHRQGGIDYASNGQVLFGVYARQESEDCFLDLVIEESYVAIFELLKAAGYPHLLRTWNYIPAIAKAQDGVERYHRLCLGRYKAFTRFDPAPERAFPAATVIGTTQGDVVVCFLAARHAGIPVENPRQVSAYRYPPQYSPRSPSFSRAMVKDWGGRAHLYASGTASIVGYETHHAGDVRAQLDEILRNLEALLAQAAHATTIAFPRRAGEGLLKVYIRRPEDIVPVRERLGQVLGTYGSVLYLQGELCRKDLLVEIEGVYWH